MPLTEENYEQIEKIIRSAVDRTVHSEVLKDIVTEAVNNAVPAAVQVTVNGKIDKQHAILEKQNEAFNAFAMAQQKANEESKSAMQEHVRQHTIVDTEVRDFIEEQKKSNAEVAPYLRGVQGFSLFWKAAIFVGTGIIMWENVSRFLFNTKT